MHDPDIINHVSLYSIVQLEEKPMRATGSGDRISYSPMVTTKVNRSNKNRKQVMSMQRAGTNYLLLSSYGLEGRNDDVIHCLHWSCQWDNEGH